MRVILLIFYFCLLGLILLAQEPVLQDSLKLDESLEVAQTDTIVSIKKAPKEFKGPLSMFAGRPGRAALYSLALPGAGQIFNKKYWKVPFVWAAEGVAIGVLVYNINSFRRWNNALIGYHSDPQIILPPAEGRSANELLDTRNRRRQYRDYSIISVVLIHFIQVADAFVNSHLIEFDVSDDLSIELGNSGLIPSIGLTATF